MFITDEFMIKKTIKRILNNFNIDIVKYNDETKHLNFEQILKKKIIKKNPVIFDVGANQGQSIKKYRNIFKNSKIHSFEPVSSAFDIMNNRFGHKKTFT
jgi:hypothetical protein